MRTIDEARAREDEALRGGCNSGLCEVLRAEVVHRMRLLGRGAAKEGSAVHHGVDAVDRGREGSRIEEIAVSELDPGFAQVGGARGVTHEGPNLVSALGKSFGEPASDLAGRSGDEDLHVSNVGSRARRGLEETDIWQYRVSASTR